MRYDLEWKSAQRKVRSGGKSSVKTFRLLVSFSSLLFSLPLFLSELLALVLIVVMFSMGSRRSLSTARTAKVKLCEKFFNFPYCSDQFCEQWMRMIDAIRDLNIQNSWQSQVDWSPHCPAYIYFYWHAKRQITLSRAQKSTSHACQIRFIMLLMLSFMKMFKVKLFNPMKILVAVPSVLAHSHDSCFASRHLIIRIKVLLFANICTINLISCRKSPRSLIVACYRVVECVDGFCESALWLATCTKRY